MGASIDGFAHQISFAIKFLFFRELFKLQCHIFYFRNIVADWRSSKFFSNVSTLLTGSVSATFSFHIFPILYFINFSPNERIHFDEQFELFQRSTSVYNRVYRICYICLCINVAHTHVWQIISTIFLRKYMARKWVNRSYLSLMYMWHFATKWPIWPITVFSKITFLAKKKNIIYPVIFFEYFYSLRYLLAHAISMQP